MKKVFWKNGERQGWVYVLHNLLNGKEYVGQTVCGVANRWKGHLDAAFRLKSQKPLYRAIRRYGKENFAVTELWTGPQSKLNAAEIRFVRQRKTFIDTGWGYNLTTGGGQYELSKLAIKKIALAARAQWDDTSKRRVIVKAIRKSAKVVDIKARVAKFKATVHTQEVTAKFSKSAKERANRPEEKAWTSIMKTVDWAREGVKEARKQTPDAIAARGKKIAAALRTPEMRFRLSTAQKESYAKDATRSERMSAAQKAAWERDPDRRIKTSLQSTGRVMSTAAIEKIRAAATAQWASKEGRAKKLTSMTKIDRKAVYTAEVREKMRRAKLGKKRSPAAVTKFKATMSAKTPKEMAAISAKSAATKRANKERKAGSVKTKS